MNKGNRTNQLKSTVTRMLLALLALFMLAGQTPAEVSETVTYFHTDGLGSVIAASDESGNLLWRERYRPFGNRLEKAVTTDEHALYYTGKPHDDATGLTYFGARHYDPVVGRFMGIDPVGVDPGNIHSFNRYVYANNNPYKYVDPDGEFGIVAALVVGAALWVGTDIVLPNFLPKPAFDSGVAVRAGFPLDAGAVAGSVKAASSAASGLGRGVLQRTPNEAGVVREFVTESDQVFYRVFSGDNVVGGFVTAVKPRSSAYAQEALALPRANSADMVQEVLVPAGTKVRRSRAAPVAENATFPSRRGGGERFELLDRIPTKNFGAGSPLK